LKDGGERLRTSTPNNLPRLQPFFGREKELAAIREALDPESRTWGALISGPGGMGKTSLAVRAAYDCPPGQFQRIIFLSVKDRELDDDGVRWLGGFILPGFLEMLNMDLSIAWASPRGAGLRRAVCRPLGKDPTGRGVGESRRHPPAQPGSQIGEKLPGDD
jgi:hypothetical protein